MSCAIGKALLRAARRTAGGHWVYSVEDVTRLLRVQADLAAGRVIAQKITDPVISRELILAHAPHRAAAPVTKAVVRLIRSTMSDLIRSGGWDGRI